MESKHLFVGILVLMVVGLARSDVQQDKTECASQLVGLFPCLQYVGGNAKTPTLDCCKGLKQVIDKSKKCLCILIKDRDDPNLGLKINVTLAATLPSTCHAPANVTECINILHLSPNSPDAKAFEGFANISSTATVASGNSTKGVSSTDAKSGSGILKRSGGIGVEMILGIFAMGFYIIF